MTDDGIDIVLCDGCSKDYTHSEESGGILFSSYGYGPCCEEGMRKNIKKHGEEEFIKGECPKDKSFADWIREDIR